MERVWSGRVQHGHEAEHERFVDWLDSAEGRGLLARSSLSSYRLVEQDGRLSITFGADEPVTFIRFLRNRRFWPDFWEFQSAGSGRLVSSGARERVTWSR